MTTLREHVPLLVFRAGGQSLALPIASVGEVLPWRGVLAVPRPGEHVLGAIRWRDGLVAVLDLAAMLLGQPGKGARMCVVAVGADVPVAFPVTRVDAMPNLALGDLVHGGFSPSPVAGRYVRAVGPASPGQVVVLNLFAIAEKLNARRPGAPR